MYDTVTQCLGEKKKKKTGGKKGFYSHGEEEFGTEQSY